MTKIEVTIGKIKATWESPFEDLTADELVRAFHGLLVAHTFHPDLVYRAMLDFSKDEVVR